MTIKLRRCSSLELWATQRDAAGREKGLAPVRARCGPIFIEPALCSVGCDWCWPPVSQAKRKNSAPSEAFGPASFR